MQETELEMLVNEYFRLTKRPVSTMTVEEFRTFCEMVASKGAVNAAPHMQGWLDDRRCNEAFRTPENAGAVPADALEKADMCPEPDNQDMILKMLQSVSG